MVYGPETGAVLPAPCFQFGLVANMETLGNFTQESVLPASPRKLEDVIVKGGFLPGSVSDGACVLSQLRERDRCH